IRTHHHASHMCPTRRASDRAALADSEASTISYELNQLRGVSLKTRIRIAPPVILLPGLPSAERMAQQAGANNFEIRALNAQLQQDRKSTRLNSSHAKISYAF